MARSWGSRVAAKQNHRRNGFPQFYPDNPTFEQPGAVSYCRSFGEFVNSGDVAKERTEECMQTIALIADEQLNSQVSLKMTSLGLDIDLDLVYENMTKILQTAEKHKVMVTIDMEDETRCQKTLDIFKDFRSRV